MTYNLMDLVGDSKMATKRENKKKLHKLLDKYGSVEEIERSGDLRDNFELDFARIDGALDEVLEERKLGYREPQSSSDDEIKTNVKKSNSLLPDDEDFSLEGLRLSDEQRRTIDRLDMTNQLAVIRALREQQGVKKPKPKKENSEASKSELDVLREKVDKANREIKVADNEYAGTKSDAEVEKEEIGSISAKYESNNNPKAVGYDNGGGYSYGKYQIETKHGTMLDYIKYLKTKPEYREYANILNNAGGYKGAKERTKTFKNAWDKLSEDENFDKSQYQFLLDKKLKPLINFTNKIKGFNVEKRHPAIKEMLYSLATQHGNKGSADLLRNAIGMDITNMSDEELVNKVYDERSKVDQYFSRIEKDKRKNIKEKRLPNERATILKLLNK
ncbi:MAG: hypothetical protein E7005_01660 [Alphaproteobacteria bacterium]|nr:hypothetical protein [Alphaproteobacteria bacterium]